MLAVMITVIYEDISPAPGIPTAGETQGVVQGLNKYLLKTQSRNDGICRRKKKEGRGGSEREGGRK